MFGCTDVQIAWHKPRHSHTVPTMDEGGLCPTTSVTLRYTMLHNNFCNFSHIQPSATL